MFHIYIVDRIYIYAISTKMLKQIAVFAKTTQNAALQEDPAKQDEMRLVPAEPHVQALGLGLRRAQNLNRWKFGHFS